LIIGFSAVLVACAERAGTDTSNSQQQQTTPADWKPVEQAIGKSGSMQPGDVFKVSLPRSDLQVTVSGAQLKPALAFGSWVAFKKTGSEAMVMGFVWFERGKRFYSLRTNRRTL